MTIQIKSTQESNPVLIDEVNQFIKRKAYRGFKKFEKDNIYLEKHSIQSLIDTYVAPFNQSITEYSDGFATDWEEDTTIDILYKNGAIRTISPQWDDGTKKVKLDGIDSIIVNGGWGTAFAGPSIKAVDYTVYEDIPDIRIDFDM